MIEHIIWIIVGVFVLDLLLTYINAIKYKKLFPNKDYTNIELNPIVKELWKRFGLLIGGILATMIQLAILIYLVLYLDKDFLLILLGFYLAVILTHLDNFFLIIKKKEKEFNWRRYAVPIIMALSILDMILTYFYIYTYHNWQNWQPYNLMELNPLLVFLWNNIGLNLGMIVGSLIIWSLIYYVVKKAHWIFSLILFIALSLGMINHYYNINELLNLIKQYPTGIIS